MRKRNAFLIIFVLISLFCNLFSTIINIPDDQPTIQQGINATTNGDTVLVQPGTYSENINFSGKNIVVVSLFITTSDIHYISNTIIDGDDNGSVITFENGENSTAVLNGFTIINGYAYSGGGINCISSNPSLKNLEIRENAAGLSLYAGGGGIFCSSSSPNLFNIVISNNSSNYSGGGIFCKDNSNPELINVMITNNSANNKGGGIFCNESNPSFVNVTISENSSNLGGGIFCFDNSNPTLINTILWNNSPQEIYFSQSNDPNSITISYSDIQDGEAGIVTNNNGIVYWLDGNIATDPLFIGNGNYNILEGSLCIDSGDPDLDNDGILWENDPDDQDPDGTRMDMGANYCYYYPVDFTTNGRFGYVDFSVSFTDLTEEYVFDFYWDFENDGVYDSNEQNPNHIYTQSGVYDIKLKIEKNIWGTCVDSLIKTNYIVVQESQLPAPQDLTININNDDVVLQWSSVPNANYYLIYSSLDPYGEYEFLEYTNNNTTYTHFGAASETDIMFYIVIGFEGTMEELNKYIEDNKKIMLKSQFRDLIK